MQMPEPGLVALVIVALLVLMVAARGLGFAPWKPFTNALARLGRRRSTARASRPPPLPIVKDVRYCQDCRHFDIDAGQLIIAQNPNFKAATQHLLPWQMGQKREVEFSEDYLALERELEEAIAARDYKRQSELTNEMMTMDPGRLKDPEEYVEPRMLRLKWEDFGACAHHEEIRANTDTCENYTPKLHAVEKAS